VTQVQEHLPSKCEALNSNPVVSPTQKRGKKKKIHRYQQYTYKLSHLSKLNTLRTCFKLVRSANFPSKVSPSSVYCFFSRLCSWFTHECFWLLKCYHYHLSACLPYPHNSSTGPVLLHTAVGCHFTSFRSSLLGDLICQRKSLIQIQYFISSPVPQNIPEHMACLLPKMLFPPWKSQLKTS
jgi:hypothetical protein